MKVLRCREVGFDCDAVVRAEDVDKVMQQVAEHASAVHDVEVTPELAEQVKSLIKDEA